MNFKKIRINILACSLLVLGVVIPSEVSYAATTYPTGLKSLHETIPGSKQLPNSSTILRASYGTSIPLLPSSIDLSNKFPEVQDQGYIGSCSAFATAYAKTYQEGLDWGWDIRSNNHIFSPSYIYSQIQKSNIDKNGEIDEKGDGGGSYISDAFDILSKQGCTTLSDMPYDGALYSWQTKPTNQQKTNALNHKSSTGSMTIESLTLNRGDVEGIKTQLVSGNAVIIAIPVYVNFQGAYTGGVYETVSGEYKGGHALCVVGYDDNKQAIKVINSWGNTWGVKGYGWISYNFIRNQMNDGYKGISAYAMIADIKDAVVSNDFDAEFYLAKYPDLREAFGDDIQAAKNHWLNYGINEGRQGAKWFDPIYYLNKYPDLVQAYGATNYEAARQHWLNYGIKEGRQASVDFSITSYITRYPDVFNEFGTKYEDVWKNWLTHGISEKRDGSLMPTPNKNDICSDDFDAEFYLAYYPDLRKKFGNNLLEAKTHWLTIGIKEGRKGASWFDPKYYLNKYPDVVKAYGAANYEAARQHWLDFGINEGRQASADFSITNYLARNGDLNRSCGTNYKAALSHWITYGINEGRDSICYDFDPSYYLATYPELKNLFGNDLLAARKHWLTVGIKEGRKGAPWFDPKYYLSQYPDLTAKFGPTNYEAAREHWLDFGIKEGRKGSPDFSIITYLNRYPDLKAAFGSNYQNGWFHWVTQGIKEGRSGSPK